MFLLLSRLCSCLNSTIIVVIPSLLDPQPALFLLVDSVYLCEYSLLVLQFVYDFVTKLAWMCNTCMHHLAMSVEKKELGTLIITRSVLIISSMFNLLYLTPNHYEHVLIDLKAVFIFLLPLLKLLTPSQSSLLAIDLFGRALSHVTLSKTLQWLHSTCQCKRSG